MDIYKKLINDPFAAVDESLDGFVAAHADIVALAEPRVVVRRSPAAGKVGIAVGGGSGHEPAFAGYVGAGMADSAACGNIFASPPPNVVLAAIRAANMERGVLLAYGNYAGDVMNFGLAAQMAAGEGIEVREIRVADDVASAPTNESDKRRGIAGDIIVFKCIGAAAERGQSLAEVERVGLKASVATRSIGVALSACEVPGSGRPTFELADDEMEIGMGVHGEPGIERGPLRPADEVAQALVDAILADAGDLGARDVALLVNGLGATAHLEQYILYRGSSQLLRACVLAAADAVEAARDELCRLDAAAGDGDHGVTMALAAKAVRQALADAPDATDHDLLVRVAMAMGSVGGASGPIYASGLLATAARLDALPAGPMTVAKMLALGEAAENAISALGHAKPGDKTILDALHPAVEALRQGQDLGVAARAARGGAEATAQMVATIGRAGRLGERSRGVPDPGATSLALVLESVHAAAARNDQ